MPIGGQSSPADLTRPAFKPDTSCICYYWLDSAVRRRFWKFITHVVLKGIFRLVVAGAGVRSADVLGSDQSSHSHVHVPFYFLSILQTLQLASGAQTRLRGDGLDQQAVHPRSSGLQPRRRRASHLVLLPAHHHRWIEWVSFCLFLNARDGDCNGFVPSTTGIP